MKMLTSLFFIIVLLPAAIAQNPYTFLGIKDNDVKALSLSPGKYDEFEKYNQYERVGSAVIDMKTMKIAYFIDRDTIVDKATFEPESASRWLSPDPLAAKYPNVSPYNFCANNPIIFIDSDGRDIVFFNMKGEETGRIKTDKINKAFVKTGTLNIQNVASWKVYSEAPMPKVIVSQTDVSGHSASRLDPKYQELDYAIAAETFIFNYNKEKGIVPSSPNGRKIDNPYSVPDLDPTLVKAVIMQETQMGCYDPNKKDNNDASKDVMQSNVYFSEKSNDWDNSKIQFGLKKGGGVLSTQQSIKAGIGILYLKGLRGSGGTEWTGGVNWENAVQRYNANIKSYSNLVFKMVDNAKKGDSSNY